MGRLWRYVEGCEEANGGGVHHSGKKSDEQNVKIVGVR